MWVVEIGVISMWGIELDLIQCRDRNWLVFLCSGRKSLGFSASVEIDLVFVWVVEKYLVQVSGSELAWFLCRGIETELISEWSSN